METAEPVRGSRTVFGLLLAVVALVAASGPGAYLLSGDKIFLDWASLWGLPWSVWPWSVDSYSSPSYVEHSVASVLLNLILASAALWLAWSRTRFGRVTAVRSTALIVGALVGGSCVLVVLGTFGVVYYDLNPYVALLLGHPFLFGLAAIALMTIAMDMLIPRGWLAVLSVTVGTLAGTVWGMAAIAVMGLQNFD